MACTNHGGNALHCDQSGALAAPRTDSCLIPEEDPVSGLLEDVRLEYGSYELLSDPADFVGPSHCGDTLIGLFLLEGAAELRSGDDRAEQLQVNDFVLLAPGRSYSLSVADGQRCLIGRVTYGFDLVRARLLLKLLPQVLVIRRLDRGEIEWQGSLALLISQQCHRGGIANAAINRRLVEAALIGVIQQYLTREARSRRHPVALLAAIGPGIQAMHHNPDRQWKVAELARISGLSRTLFAEKFLQSTGETPLRYLTRLRMERGRELLARSTLSLAMIAHRTGYGTDVAFARAFKRQFGVSPGRFRAGCEGGAPAAQAPKAVSSGMGSCSGSRGRDHKEQSGFV